MKCRYCAVEIPKERLQCPSCKQWNLGPVESAESDTVLLSDAQKEGGLVRIPLGMWSEAFGGGMVDTSVNLVAGEPGAGKTTSFLQMCDCVLDFYKESTDTVLYVGSEQAASELGDFARRIGQVHADRIRIVKAMGGLQRNLSEYLDEFKPRMTILDSITGLIGKDLEMSVELAKIMKEHSTLRKFPTMIVNQINSGGDHMGLMKLQHEVDALFIITVDHVGGKMVPDAYRYFECETKNRFGQTPALVRMRMMPNDTPIVVGQSGPGRLYEVPFEDEE